MPTDPNPADLIPNPAERAADAADAPVAAAGTEAEAPEADTAAPAVESAAPAVDVSAPEADVAAPAADAAGLAPAADEGADAGQGADAAAGDAPDSAAPVSVEARPPSAHRPGLPARTTPPPETDVSPIETARLVVEAAEDKKAADIVLLEIAPLTTVADYLVICSGGSERQLDAIGDGISQALKHAGVPLVGREGEPDSHWVLIDAGSVIVHIFAPPEREFYALERMWTEAKTILRVQ